MKRSTRPVSLLAALVAACLPLLPVAASAQDYFIPGAPRQQAPQSPRPAAQRPQPALRPQAAPQAAQQPVQQQQTPFYGAPAGQMAGQAPGQAPGLGLGGPPLLQQEDQVDPGLQVQLPPVPELPPLPKVAPPPLPVIGVMGVPEVMRASTAAQQVDKTISERREKLTGDAQKEQAMWRDMQQQLTAQRANMSPEQIRAKERELQERITNSQKLFRERNRIVQSAAQAGIGQIERTLVAVIRQVAESHGMNLVLHRQQVALNVNEFDITDQVAQQLNKIMPSVTIPPEPPVVDATQAALPGPRAKP